MAVMVLLGWAAAGSRVLGAEHPAVASAAALESYLSSQPACRITSVVVAAKTITVSAQLAPGSEAPRLAEVPLEFLVDDPRRFETLTPLDPAPDGSFSVTLARARIRDGCSYDRLTSRWQLVAAGPAATPVSHARYADEVACRSPGLEAARPASKKGLGGWHHDRGPKGEDELQALGIASITVNVVLDSLLSLTEEPQRTSPVVWQGRTYHVREQELRGLDATFQQAQERGIMVSAILLVRTHGGLAHPAATDPGRYAMPDVTSTDGADFYGAVLNVLAERWTRADGRYGRVHHWIMHNEVDAGWEWTNAGEQPALVYMDLYQRSLRLMNLIVRQYDPHAAVFISLTHHWTEASQPHGYGSRQMLELLTRFGRAEGDFRWGVAFHPYPQNLTNPRTWEDDQASFSLATRKVTPRNLEVLDAFMHLPEMRFGGALRPVHLAENGFNSRDYSDAALADQAAGMALAWHKVAALESIQAWHYHNWVDNRNEFGLRIGLRRYPDDPAAPLGRKPIWYLYQALGTPREQAACAPYLRVVGVGGWAEVLHRGPIN